MVYEALVLSSDAAAGQGAILLAFSSSKYELCTRFLLTTSGTRKTVPQPIAILDYC